MASEAAMTVIKMLETLPAHSQDRAVEHLREYIEDLRDEALWDESFSRTQGNLISAARKVRREIAEGKAKPLDIESL
jgi:hypothetical protein